jgi:hypothetical protein
MVPLKIAMIGFKWELMVVISIMFALLGFAWVKLHALRLPFSWQWTLFYAAVVTAVCKVLHVVTHYYITGMEAIHVEVLLPAFVIGCVIDTPCARAELSIQKRVTLERRITREMSKSCSNTSVSTIAISGVTQTREEEDPDSKDSIVKEPGSLSKNTLFATRKATEPVPVPPGWVTDESGSSLDAAPSEDTDITPQSLPEQAPLEPIGENSPAGMQLLEYTRPLRPSISSEDSITKNPLHRPSNSGRQPSKNSAGSSHTKSSSKSSDYEPTRVRRSSEVDRYPSKASRRSSVSSVASMQSQLSRHGLEIEATSVWEPFVQTTVSMVFMVLVGLSMPALIGNNAGDNDTDMGAGLIVLHVLAVSLLMVLGKMFPCVCYRDEAPIIHRLALCLGMCPRGEVGASIIVISLELGVQGPAITISMCALVINLVFSGGFIGLVKLLLAGSTSAS